MGLYAVTTAGDSLEFDTQNGVGHKALLVDTNHVLCAWGGEVGTTGQAQIFTIDTSTWAVSTANTKFNFEAAGMGVGNVALAQVDTNHFIGFWTGASTDGYTGVFQVNTTTWAVSMPSAALEFDIGQGVWPSCAKIDTNHFIAFWQGVSADGFVQTFTVNTTTWAVTTAAAPLEFDTQNNLYNSCFRIDETHYINFWAGLDSLGTDGPDGFVQVFAVNTTTWAVTTAADVLEFATEGGEFHSCYQVDTNHFINVWRSYGSTGDLGKVQVFEVNTTTWAVTTAGALMNLTGNINPDWFEITQMDSNHFLVSYVGSGGDGFAEVLEVNTSTWAVTTKAVALEYDTQDSNYISLVKIDSSHYVNVWQGPAADGFVQVLQIEYSGIKTINGVTKAGTKTFVDQTFTSVKVVNDVTRQL